ncbi:hypothetical protein DUNSADRAFT_7237 [Dunaliella salina]|uniref:Encoded protein n=1 Tax=Dunaliella salina TaxID=3046 RepID=A0ABQ7GLQ4_DUNSA|nr:hypothetical protein DUNSADRAFT_7237 [Dunaliella salina]|eukprot:KAF5835538.1 hypothetical protein DUNSADRAFT_7237 [Dunaliella salina]
MPFPLLAWLAAPVYSDNENSFELLYTGSGANPLLSKDFVMQLPASPEPRQITVQTLPTVGEESFDTWLWVSTKCGLDVNIGETVAQNDDFGDSSLSLVSFTAEPDQDYFISVEGYDGACGTIQVQVEVDQLLLEESPAHLPKEGVFSSSLTIFHLGYKALHMRIRSCCFPFHVIATSF